MKGCVECGKKLGIMEGYSHPTMGREYLLCGSCFDTVSASVKEWSKFISQYAGFFNEKSFENHDVQRIERKITKNVQNKLNLLFRNTNQNIKKDITITN